MKDNLDIQTTYRAIIDAARRRCFISYGDLAKANRAEWRKVRHKLNDLLGELVKLAAERKWPIPSAIVVNQRNLETGTFDHKGMQGFISAAKEYGFDVQDPQAFIEEQ